LAIIKGKMKAAKYLVRNAAPVNAVDKHGKPPLDYASFEDAFMLKSKQKRRLSIAVGC
jgi:ankyrin repeat protein